MYNDKELKPCPFCEGWNPTVNKEKRKRWYVNCVHCSASTAYCNTKLQAIKAWNTRQPDLQAQLALANETIENLKRAMKIHAGDILSAENETDGFRLDKKELEEQLKQAEAEIEELREFLETRTVPLNTPSIICLCGSTRFMDAFFEAGWKFTLQGRIVLSVGVCKHAEHHGGEALGQNVADKLDELHLRKIDLADSVFVLNVGGYIGDSTRKEIEYAKSKDKFIEYLEALTEKG